MNDQELRAFIAEIVKFDNRKISQAMILSWGDIAHFGHWTYAEAMEALTWHAANSTEWLMPAHINLRIKDQRQMPVRPAELPQIARKPPAAPETIKTVMRELRERMGWPKKATTYSDPELTVKCPHEPCSAGIDSPCRKLWSHGRRQGTYTAIDTYHDSRTKAAETEAP